MHVRAAVAAASLVLTALAATPAAATTTSVGLSFEERGGGQVMTFVSARSDASSEAIRVDAQSPRGGLVRATQIDPANDGVRIQFDELGWVPANRGVTVTVDDGEATTVDIPPLSLEFGSAPQTYRGQGLPGLEVQVSLTIGFRIRHRVTVMADADGEWTADLRTATGGDGAAPTAWTMDTTVNARQFTDVGDTEVSLSTQRQTPAAKVTLHDGVDEVQLTKLVPGDPVTVGGRTTVTGATRDSSIELDDTPDISVDGATARVDPSPAVDVTSWDGDGYVTSGRALPGASLEIRFQTPSPRSFGSNAFVDADDQGNWSVSFPGLATFAGGGSFPSATISATARDLDPADGIVYSRERSFGPDGRRAVIVAPTGEDTTATHRREPRAEAVVRLTVPLDQEGLLSIQNVPGTGDRYRFQATTADGDVHVADVVGDLTFFGVTSRDVTRRDFVPPLDLAVGYDLEVTRGDTNSSYQISALTQVFDPTTTTFTGRTKPGATVTLMAEAPGVADDDASKVVTTAAGDGSFTVSADRPAEGFAPSLSVSGAGHTLEGGLSTVIPLVVDAAGGATAQAGSSLVLRVAGDAVDGTTVSVRPPPRRASALDRGYEVFVRPEGERRRTMTATTTVAIHLDEGAALDGAQPTLIITDRQPTSGGTTTAEARLDVPTLLCLDPDDLPTGCDELLPTPYAVLSNVPIGGLLSVVAAPTAAPMVIRAAGEDRVQTSVALSMQRYPIASIFGIRLADTIILANAGNFPDALAAAPLASALNGPVILNPTPELHPAVDAELRRLGPSTVVLMGGPSALSADVEAAVRTALPDAVIQRLAGDDRYATAALAADLAVATWSTTHATAGQGVLVALGTHPTNVNRAWPDALAAGPLAARSFQPILLTAPGGVPDATRAAIDRLDPTSITVLGGPAAIPESTAEALADGRDLARIGGQDRYETSTLLADEAFAYGGSRATTLLATGQSFPDGLAASATAAASQGSLVLSPTAALSNPSTAGWIEAHAGEFDRVIIAGGEVALSAQVEADLNARLR